MIKINVGPNPQITGPGPRTSGFFNPWPLQSVPIVTDVGSNLDQGEVYNIMW